MEFKRLFVLVSYILMISVSVFSQNAISHITATEGVLDLREWDPRQGETVSLKGEWLFQWGQFALPGHEIMEQNSQTMTVPSYWNRMGGGKFPPQGYATYQLKILLPPENLSYALDIDYILSSYILYEGTRLLAYAGSPGRDKESTEPSLKPQTVIINPGNDEILLTLHVSNFHFNEGGIKRIISFGEAQTIRRNRERILSFEIFIISSMLVMALYHTGMYFNRKKEVSALFFSLFCLFMALHSLTTGEMFLLNLFPSIPWNYLTKLEYLGYYLAVPFFLLYLHSLFPRESIRRLLYPIYALTLIFVIQVITLPPLIFTKTLVFFQLITLLVGLLSLIILIKAVYNHRQSSITLLIGFIVLFATFINDMLVSNEIIYTTILVPLGVFAFIYTQALLMLGRATSAHNTVENQRNELIRSQDMFERSRLGTILGLAKLAEYRDEDTGTHLERIREYCRVLAVELSHTDDYRGYVTETYIKDLYQSAILHDIGKVGVPDNILLKKGKLDAEEFENIKKHANIGGDALQTIESKTAMKSFLTLGKEIAWYHHEKWNGSGYPKGLKEKEIPLSARITAVADVYDALTSERPYKEAFTHEKAVEIIRQGRGSHFDPFITDVFIKNEDRFRIIRESLGDN